MLPTAKCWYCFAVQVGYKIIHLSKFFHFLRGAWIGLWEEFPYDFELMKHFFGMWGMGKFVGKVLPCPMFVMLAVSPQTRLAQVVDVASKGDTDVGLILPVPKGELLFGVIGLVFLHFTILRVF